MRPRGEVRDVLASAAGELVQMAGRGVTWRELAQHTQVGGEVARATVRNMERAGELRSVGEVHVAGVNRPMTAYAPAEQGSGDASLAEVIKGWAAFV
jgi:ribosomal protein S25